MKKLYTIALIAMLTLACKKAPKPEDTSFYDGNLKGTWVVAQVKEQYYRYDTPTHHTYWKAGESRVNSLLADTTAVAWTIEDSSFISFDTNYTFIATRTSGSAGNSMLKNVLPNTGSWNIVDEKLMLSTIQDDYSGYKTHILSWTALYEHSKKTLSLECYIPNIKDTTGRPGKYTTIALQKR